MKRRGSNLSLRKCDAYVSLKYSFVMTSCLPHITFHNGIWW